jgi:hypothetical protein
MPACCRPSSPASERNPGLAKPAGNRISTVWRLIQPSGISHSPVSPFPSKKVHRLSFRVAADPEVQRGMIDPEEFGNERA